MKAVSFIKLFITQLVLYFPGVLSEKCAELSDDFDVAQIILFYSPWNSSLIREQIMLYWNNPFFDKEDVIALYYGIPDIHNNKPIFKYKPLKHTGYVETKISPAKSMYELDSSYIEQCTGYYGAWLRNNVIRKTKCLSTHPDWMSKRRNTIGRMLLGKLFLPGTHDSGAYGDEPQPTVVQRYAVTQDKDVLDQLVAGARYIDLRPARYGNEYWINHDKYQINLLENVIYDIKEFMSNTNEIVILGFKEFPVGFNSIEDHENFVKYLETEFADFLLTRRENNEWTITLNEIWASGKRLILSYDCVIQGNSLSLWSSVEQQWGDARTIHELKKYLNFIEEEAGVNYIPSYPIRLRAAMAEITLNEWRIVGDVLLEIIASGGSLSLRQIGVKIGPSITSWYNEYWYSTANIVAVDFLDTTGIVEVAIDWNERRASPCYKYFKELYRNMTVKDFKLHY